MAHGLEARVPFLDLEFIELALSLPLEWKLHGPGRTEKWVLCQAFDGYLPDDILWRDKEQFNEGSGMSSVLRQQLAGTIDEHTFLAQRDILDPPLASREEMVYFRLFNRRYPGLNIAKVAGRSPAAFATE